MEHLLILGQGYVGLPLAVAAAKAGFLVTGYEPDPIRYNSLMSGQSYIEDISSETIRELTQMGSYNVVNLEDNIGPFKYAIITVPTPLSEGIPDMTHIRAAAKMLSRNLSKDSLVVLESTTYPGTTQELLIPILEESGLKAGVDFYVGYSPERIDPGNKTWGLTNTPKIVSGINPESLSRVTQLYEKFVEHLVPVANPAEAELAKLIENTFRHVNVALVNELAMFADDLGIDIWNAINAAASKPFGFMAFYPGPGVGGHCLPIDPSYLSWKVKRQLNKSFRFVELANDVNDHMPDYIVLRLLKSLNSRSKSVKGARVILIGVAYKKNTSDIRESPALEIWEKLHLLGADVLLVDPLVNPSAIPQQANWCELSDSILSDSDAVVILAPHDIFDLKLIVKNSKFIFDTRHVVEGENVEYL